MSDKEKTTSNHARETAYEVGLNLLPYVGGGLAALYTSNRDKKKFQRIESFYEETSAKINQMDQSLKELLKEQTHDNDSIISLIEQVNEKIEKENRDIKKQCLQKFLINSLLNSTTEETLDQREYFLDALSNLTIFEIELISLLYREDRIINMNDIGMHNNEDRYAVLGFVNRVRNYGFLELYIGGEFHVGAVDNSLNDNVKISEFGKRFVTFCLV